MLLRLSGWALSLFVFKKKTKPETAAVSKLQPSAPRRLEGYYMGRASFVLMRTKFIAKGNYESHDCQNENNHHNVSLDVSRSLTFVFCGPEHSGWETLLKQDGWTLI